jgi:hypothetical protein
VDTLFSGFLAPGFPMNNAAKMEVLRLAATVVNGELEMIHGCRLLVSHFGDAGLRDDPDALVIVGVESETDDLPVADQREYWNQPALAVKIAAKEEYIATVRPMVIEACRALAAKLCAEARPAG